MSKYKQGVYTPKHPEKYIGKGKIQLRSSWEFSVAHFFDENVNVIEWASEPIRIPYRHPLTGKQTTYVPDFLVRYKDKSDAVKTELVEVKPRNQSMLTEKMSPNQRATVAVNFAKWDAARKFCKQQGIKFRIITENEIYRK